MSSVVSLGFKVHFTVYCVNFTHSYIYCVLHELSRSSCSLASKILEYNSQVEQPLDSNDPSSKPDLARLLKEYENRRWLPTTSITAKAALLGELIVLMKFFFPSLHAKSRKYSILLTPLY